MNCSTLSVACFLADSSSFIILPGISAPATMFCATPWKGSFKLPTSPAVCSSCLLIFPGVDSLWFESVFKIHFVFDFFFKFGQYMGVQDEIILSINRSIVPTSHRTPSDFDLSVDGSFSVQVPWNSQTFFSAISISETNNFYIRKSLGFCY